jgi:predicted permease
MTVSDFVDSIGRDLHYALRGLPRRPAFTLAAVLTLAVGIGATTAIFSVVYSVLIKPLPYPNADELVRIRYSAPGINLPDLQASSNMYLTYREESRAFADIGLWQQSSATLSDGGESERVNVLRVTDGTLQALGVQPGHGRWFTEQEHGPAPEGPAPIILSHAFSQRRFGAGEAAVGRDLSIEAPGGNGAWPSIGPSRVVGVMPPDFRFLDVTPPPDVIIAVRLDPARQAHGVYQWEMLARLTPGVTLNESRADVDRMLPIWRDAWPPFPGTSRADFESMRITPIVRPLKDDLVGGVASMLWLLMGAIGAVLLIACANIANLMLVRADARRTELAVRAALGALPARIAREVFIESLCVGVAGSVFGLLLAYFGLQGLVAMGPSSLPRLHEIAVYPPVLGFAAAASLASTLAFGSIAALKYAFGSDRPAMLTARGSSAGRQQGRVRSALVVVQVALALLSIVSAALMARTFQALSEVDPGFSDPATIQTAKTWIPTSQFHDPAQYTAMQREMIDKIAALPGVEAVGFSDAVPIEWSGMSTGIAVEGQASTVAAQQRIKFVSPDYFEAMGTRVIAGRDITWADVEAGGRVAVISEGYARALGGEPRDALGKRIRLAAFSQNPWREVIGVVQNVHESGLYEAPPGMVYWPVLTENMFSNPTVGTPVATFAIRSTRAGTAAFVQEIRAAIRSVSASVPIAGERTMQELYSGSMARTSFTLVMLAVAGAMALTLGVIGIYGVIAYGVAQRMREIGIRSALGADPRRLEKMFLLHGLALSGAGALLGVAVAAASSRSMASVLFGVEPLDAGAFFAATGVVLTAAALASYVPARRAANVNPIETLRAE